MTNPRHLQGSRRHCPRSVGQRDHLPTFLDITFQVRAALKDPNLSVEQLSKLVGAEPLMSAKIIRMANSVALNPSGPGDRRRQERHRPRRHGGGAYRVLRRGHGAVAEIEADAAVRGHFQALWEHTSHVAALCRVLARKLAKINGDEAMFAGLVHDLGVFYLMSRAANFPELVNDKAELHGAAGRLARQHRPRAALGARFAGIGARSRPEHETDREISEVKTLSDVLYVANKIANRTSSWRDPELDGGRYLDARHVCSMPKRWPKSSRNREEEVQSLKKHWALGGRRQRTVTGRAARSEGRRIDRGSMMSSHESFRRRSPANVWPHWRWPRSASSMATSAPARCMRSRKSLPAITRFRSRRQYLRQPLALLLGADHRRFDQVRDLHHARRQPRRGRHHGADRAGPAYAPRQAASTASGS
jgi:hypothetical protein